MEIWIWIREIPENHQYVHHIYHIVGIEIGLGTTDIVTYCSSHSLSELKVYYNFKLVEHKLPCRYSMQNICNNMTAIRKMKNSYLKVPRGQDNEISNTQGLSMHFKVVAKHPNNNYVAPIFTSNYYQNVISTPNYLTVSTDSMCSYRNH